MNDTADPGNRDPHATRPETEKPETQRTSEPSETTDRKKPLPMQTLICKVDTNEAHQTVLVLCDEAPRVLTDAEITARVTALPQGDYVLIKGRLTTVTFVQETVNHVVIGGSPEREHTKRV